MSYVVEHYLPVPPRGGAKGRSIYPFAGMNIGDHFFVDDRNLKAVQAAISNAQKVHHAKYLCRLHTEDGVSGVMVWRDA